MNVILFGFTGLGSAVLRGLLNEPSVDVTSVFTKKYSYPYPFYKEIQIQELCNEKDIECYSDKKVNSNEVVNLIENQKPDLIIVSSFNQIISRKVIEIPTLAILNVHPSLLPCYRGPFPDQAVLLNGENKTGVTVHYLTEALDSGNILLQKSLEIDPADNYCTLKKKLADLAMEIIPEIIKLFSGSQKPEGTKQDDAKASFFSRPNAEDGYLETEKNIETIKNKIRALNPFPGTSILVNNQRIKVDRMEIPDMQNSNHGKKELDEYVDIIINSTFVKLHKTKINSFN